ncbi:MAG: hypothetical protein WBD25_09615 [Terriglobales bacterium]
MVAAEGNGGEHIFSIARNYDADWDLAIIGAVGSVESAATGVEADLSSKMAAESGFKRGWVELRGMRRGWGDVLRHKVQNILEDADAGRKAESGSIAYTRTWNGFSVACVGMSCGDQYDF